MQLAENLSHIYYFAFCLYLIIIRPQNYRFSSIYTIPKKRYCSRRAPPMRPTEDPAGLPYKLASRWIGPVSFYTLPKPKNFTNFPNSSKTTQIKEKPS
jgi:hypothetical protein